MLAIVFFGMFQHEVAQTQLRRLVNTARSEAGEGCVAVCNASGLFASAPGLDAQVEQLFESGIDLVFLGEQSVARNAGRSALFSGRWPLVRPLNLPDDAPGKGALLFETAIGPVWMLSISDGSGKGQVSPAHCALDSFFRNKKDAFPVFINVHGVDLEYKKALSWKYAGVSSATAWFGCGTGFPVSLVEIDGNGNIFLADTGSVVSENTIAGVSGDIWWKRNIEKIPVTSVPGWGCLHCDYSIVWFDSKGKAQKYMQKSLKV